MRKRRNAVLNVLALAAVSRAAIVHPQAVPHPELNTDLLGQLNVVGAFSGLSAYKYAGQNSMLSEPVASDNIISQPGDNLYVSSLLADGTVKASCLLEDNQTVVLAGDFTHVRNQSTPGVALLDLGSGSISPLGDADLSGQVNALVCNGSQVVVGGNFSMNGVHGVYIWENANQSWIPPAFGGFAAGAVVETIALYNDNIVFGGSLQGLANTSLSGSSTLVQNQQEIAMSQAVINTTNGATGSDGSHALCPGNGGFQAGANNQPATITIDVGTTVTPSRMRLYNLDSSEGTSMFRLLTSPAESIMNLTYVDTNGTTQYCDAWCTLPASTSQQPHTDFEFVNVVPAESFELVLLQGYGDQAGIDGVQFYQNNLVVSANQNINTPLSCQPAAASNSSSQTTGSWQTNSQGLTANISNTQELQNTLVTLRPGVLSESNYTIHMYTPGCSQDGSCAQRGQVNVTVNPGTGASSVSTILYQTNEEVKYDEIYNGTLSAGATIELRPASGQALPITMVAGQATLIWQGSTGHVDISNLFEFSPANFTTYAANGSFVPVGPSLINTLSSQLGANASVLALLAANQSLFIGGQITNGTYTNLLQIEDNQLQQHETDPVTGLKLLNETALATTDSGVYSIGSSLSQIYGESADITPFNLNGTDFWAFTSSSNLTLYNPSNSSFYGGRTSVNGHLAACYQVLNSTFYIGSLQISTSTNGGSAVLQPDLSLVPLPFEFSSSNASSLRRRDDSSSSSDTNAIYDAAYFNSSSKIIVGHFAALTSGNSTAHNALLVVNGNASSPVPLDGVDTSSTFYSVAAYRGVAALSGTVSGTVNGTQVGGIVFYNSTSGALVVPPLLSNNVSVAQALFHNDSSQVAVLGSFNGSSVDCRGFCLYDTDSGSWSVPINGLEGTVTHGQFLTRDQLLFAGEFSVNGTAAHFGYYNFNNGTFDAFGADGLSGVVTSFGLGSSSSNDDLIVASGRSTNGSAFISYYTGSQWTSLDHPLHDSSDILGVTLLPVSSGNSSAPLQSNQILAVSGKLSMDTYGNAGTVSYDGSRWLPLLAAVGAGGQAGTINGLASQLPLRTPGEGVSAPSPTPVPSPDHHMSRGRVVGVACAIAVGCVSLLVLLGLGVSKVTGRKDQYMPMRVSAQDVAQTYTPQALGGAK